MHIILVDTHRKSLMPLSLTRPVSHLLIGIDRIIDKWARYANGQPGVLTAGYLGLSDTVPPHGQDDHAVFVSASVLPSRVLMAELALLEPGQVLVKDDFAVAARWDDSIVANLQSGIDGERNLMPKDFGADRIEFKHPTEVVRRPADIFSLNDVVLRRDFREITKNYRTTGSGEDAYIKGTEIYIGDGAVLNRCILNTETGPIFIGKHAEIMEGAVIRGPFALGESSVVKMGAKIYGATTIGAHSKVGGEVNNVVMHDYSNKGHDGFLGNSVLGSWCNLGADTNTSNLKNNYGTVRVWNYDTDTYEDTGRQFHGLIMGDHSKTGINAMLNTGTVIGVSTNVFGGGFPPKFIPSFRWGSPEEGFTPYLQAKAVEAAKAMMVRRSLDFTSVEAGIFDFIAERDRRYEV